MPSIMLLFLLVLGIEHKTAYGDEVSSEENDILAIIQAPWLKSQVCLVRENLFSLLELKKDGLNLNCGDLGKFQCRS